MCVKFNTKFQINAGATVLLKDLPYIAVLEDLFKVILQITLSPSEFVKRSVTVVLVLILECSNFDGYGHCCMMHNKKIIEICNKLFDYNKLILHPAYLHVQA